MSDAYSKEIPVKLPSNVLKELSEINQARTVFHLALHWLGIAAAIVLATKYFSLPVYLLAVAWIGARQHALGVLMHDGSHYRLFKNRSLNDWLTDLFCSWPLLVEVDGFRRSHWPHHRKPNTSEDPVWMDRQTKHWEFPKTRWQLAKLLGKDLLGLRTIDQLLRIRKLTAGKAAKLETARRPYYTVVRIAFYVVLATALTYFGVWKEYLLFWIVPIFTWLQFVLRLRAIAEHYAVENVHSLNITRTTIPSILDLLFIGPCNVGYHIEHHLYPSVPFYRLPELHAHLMKDREYNLKAHVTNGYWGVLKECVRV